MELTKLSIQRLKSCDKRLYLITIEAIKKSPYQFIITSGYRTIDEQQKLYAQGRNESGKIVTNIDGINKKSNHNYFPSRAFDIAIIIEDKVTWDIQYYKIVAQHIKDTAIKMGFKIQWGGDWEGNFKDMPHFELK